MALAPTYKDPVRGHFRHKQTNVLFEYNNTPSAWGKEFGCTNQIYLIDGNIRDARILGTVAHVAVDEDQRGDAVFEKWEIKQHVRYQTLKEHSSV